MSEFIGSVASTLNFRVYSSNFRPLDILGYPNYLIDLEGVCINIFTGNIAATESRYGSYTLRHPFSTNASLANFPPQYLVKITWWDAPIEQIFTSPYSEWIIQYREFKLLPDEDKIVLPYRNNTGGYILTRYGSVWSTRYMVKLTPQVGRSGYGHVSFNKDAMNMDVHRLVCEYFVPIPQEYIDDGYTKDTLFINHLDGNKLNNRWDNLEWSTPKSNMVHASYNNLMSTTISDDLLEQIWILLSKNYSDTTISEETGVPMPTIGNIRHQQSLRYKTDKYDWPGKNDLDTRVADKYINLINAYNKGLHMQEIAMKYNTSEATIRRALNKFPELVIERKYEVKHRNEKLTPEELNKVFDLLEQGLNNAEIAKIMLRPINNIRDIRIRKNFSKESQGRKWPMNPNVPQIRDPEWIKKVMDLYNQGMSGLAISKKLDGISRDNVLRIIRNNK